MFDFESEMNGIGFKFDVINYDGESFSDDGVDGIKENITNICSKYNREFTDDKKEVATNKMYYLSV